MEFKLKGKLSEKFDTVQVTEKFKKREFVIATKEETGSGKTFVEEIKMQLIGDRCSSIDSIPVGSDIEVSFNIKGKRFEKDGKVSYFNNLDAWKVTTSAAAQSEAHAFDQPAGAVAPDDDLPF